MRITPRPITATDSVDQSRDSSGLNKWARSSRSIDFIMLILGWFTIPVEVFLRRDFGQRWFTATNFYAGFFLLLIFTTIEYVIAELKEALQDFIADIASSINPLYTPDGYVFENRLMDSRMLLLLIVYMFMGSYHLFKVWWRNRTNTALHSFNDGTSRLEPLAGLFMPIINVIATPLVYLYVLFIPRKQRASLPVPSLIHDRTAFTNTVIEPLLLFILAIKVDGIMSLWLFSSAVALSIHANWKETAKIGKVLDFRDSILDAKVMMQLRQETAQNNVQNHLMQQIAVSIKDTPQITSQVAEQYPDLMNIIEEMNRDKSHLSK